MITFEVISAVTLQRGDDRISLRPGARLRIDPDDDEFSNRELRRAIDAGRLRPVAGLYALAARLAR
jgi:hypothetical protein